MQPTKTYKYTPSYGEEREVALAFESYESNDTLAVLMMERPNREFCKYYGLSCKQAQQFVEEYGTVTVNLPESDLLPKDTQFVDENNMPGIGGWLTENGIAEPTAFAVQSGFCTYRAFKFNIPDIN